MATLQEILTQVQQLRQEVEALPGRISVSGAQVVVVNGLSDISEKLGLIQAGEFRTGNRVSPGDGFSGVRIAYPPVSYGGNLYNLLGVDNDTVTVAFNSSDGTLITGDTEVTLSSDGIVMLESTLSRFRFIDGSALRSGDITKAATSNMSIRSDTDLRFDVGVDIGTGGSTGAKIDFRVYDTGQDAGQAAMQWSRWTESANMGLLEMGGVAGGAILRIGSSDGVWLHGDDQSTGHNYLRIGTTPSSPAIASSDNLQVVMYMAGDKLVFTTWDNAGSQARYLYLSLGGGSTDWIASTDAPTTST